MKKNLGQDAIYDARELGVPRMLVLGLQHLFAMFGATVLVPILVTKYGLPLSIQTTLLFAGLGTLLFHLCTKLKVPAFLGSSFAFLGGFEAVASLDVGKFAGMSGEEKLPYALGGIVVAGALYLILALLFKLVGPQKVMRFFPPIVTGPIIILIGLNLSGSAIANASTCWWLALVAIAIIGVLALMELCRRCVGLPILCVAGVLIVYAFINQLSYAGAVNGTTLYDALKTIIYKLFYTTSGVIGTPINVCYTYIVLFIIFGAFLERTGIANFFISFANRLAGWSSGGPAKVAVISSALCGMVSGSSVGNTVTTGSVTIPMMKKTGYKPEFAGAVEAAASTGGQIMPPIMGAAAFLMAEYMNIPYAKVAVKAILPAVLYFTGIFIAVHLEAKKLGLKGMPKSEMVSWGELAKRAYLIIPLALLIFLVSSGSRTMQFSAAVSILAAIVVGFLNKDERLTFGKIVEALEAGAKGAITVAVACAMAGMIAGCITVTGLASILINAIVQMAGDATMIGLLLTMICCIILGMGVPTTANYCIMASTCAPILVQMGFPLVAAHFFVFYFGIVADITPPVPMPAPPLPRPTL